MYIYSPLIWTSPFIFPAFDDIGKFQEISYSEDHSSALPRFIYFLALYSLHIYSLTSQNMANARGINSNDVSLDLTINSER